VGKYRKKPVVIEAVQFHGSTTEKVAIENWIAGGPFPRPGGVHTRDITSFSIETLEGDMKVRPGWWVIQGVQGEFYPCDPDIFEKTYEEVSA